MFKHLLSKQALRSKVQAPVFRSLMSSTATKVARAIPIMHVRAMSSTSQN